jgi:hypothetical protein
VIFKLSAGSSGAWLNSNAGVSEKSKRPYTAGHFGEGMKVQINRLLADGKCDGISYITGRCKWDFRHTTALHCDYWFL